MKRLAIVLAVVMSTFTFMTPAKADNAANRDECIAKGEEAVKLIKEIGKEAALKKIQNTIDDDMRFYWDFGYVFVIENESATFLAHPVFSHLVGTSQLNRKGDDGKFCYQEMIRLAETKGKGWVSYNMRRLKRDCYVLKVPGENLIVVSVLKL